MGTLVAGVLAAVAVGALLAALARGRSALIRARRAEAARQHHEAALADVSAELEQVRERLVEEERDSLGKSAEIDRLERRCREQARDAERAERDRDLERRLNRQLKEQLAKLHQEQGLLGKADDVRELVLRIAISLLGAQKGLLLSRLDGDGDGDLDLVCSEGFEHDPEGSAVAQYFAAQVIEQDRTVRAEDPEELDLAERTPADEEIESLCAIPIYLQDSFAGVVVCANKPGGFDEYDDDVLLALGDHAGAVLENARIHGRLRQSYLATVQVLTDAIEAKDRELRSHSSDVSTYVLAVARALGLPPKRREQLVFASLLHDIGKIGISELILLKPGPLTPEERAICEQHPRIGYRLVEQIPELREIAPAVLHHHERWDGDGYPTGLRGDEIPIEARVIAVADAFSAMRADRPYRAGMPVDDACAELKRCAGTQFDADIVRLFTEEIDKRPPTSTTTDALATALQDPELQVKLRDGDHILGAVALSAVDTLPTLYSHRHLHELAEAEASRGDLQRRPFAVVVARLPGLATINSERGYDAGDELLRLLATAVEQVATRCGGTAARESGARIALLAPGADGTEADRLAEEIATEFAARDGNTRLELKCAVHRRGESGDETIRRARSDARSVAGVR